MTKTDMSGRDIGYLCAYIAFVGICVAAEWYLTLGALIVSGLIVGLINDFGEEKS